MAGAYLVEVREFSLFFFSDVFIFGLFSFEAMGMTFFTFPIFLYEKSVEAESNF